MTRTIVWDLRIDWDFDGIYTDESARLVSAGGTLQLADPVSSVSSPRGIVDPCSLILKNVDGRYSPLNSAGPLYDDIKLGGAYNAPMYLRVSVDGGSNYARVFTGVIKIPKEGPSYPGVGATAQIDCRSREELLLNKRISTSIDDFEALHDSYATESEIVAQFLEDGGLSSGDFTLDSGMFVVPWAWLDDESPIEDVWTLSAACGGRFYVDPDGEYRYENMAHWLLPPHDTSQETLDESGYGQMDGPTYNDIDLYSGVTVQASPRDTLASTTIWTADDIISVPANSSKVITAKLRQPAYAITSATYTAVTGGGTDMAASISVAYLEYAQRVVMTITNANLEYSAEITAFALIGIPVSGGPSLEVTQESSIPFWADFAATRPGRVRLIQGNAYLQTQQQADALAEFLRDRYQLPRLSWTLRNVPGKPGRRLGDRITVSNAAAMPDARDGFLIGITWRLSNRGFGQDLAFLDAGNVGDGTGLYPYDNYFIIGTNELGDGSDPDNARVFY